VCVCDYISLLCSSTRYGLDGPGIESRWGRYFSLLSRASLGPTHPPAERVPSHFPGSSGRGMALTTHCHLALRLETRAILLLPLCAFMAGYRANFIFIVCTDMFIYLTRSTVYCRRCTNSLWCFCADVAIR
jgi:hypothetical protein